MKLFFLVLSKIFLFYYDRSPFLFYLFSLTGIEKGKYYKGVGEHLHGSGVYFSFFFFFFCYYLSLYLALVGEKAGSCLFLFFLSFYLFMRSDCERQTSQHLDSFVFFCFFFIFVMIMYLSIPFPFPFYLLPESSDV